MMLLLFNAILVTMIWVLGIKIATSEDMVLEKLGKYGEQKVKEGYKIFEALWVCQWCMPSIHSFIGYLFLIGMGVIQSFSWKLVVMYPLVAMGTSLVAGLIWNAYETKNAEREYYKTMTE